MHNIQGIQFDRCKRDFYQLTLHRKMPPVPEDVPVDEWKKLYKNYFLKRHRDWWAREWRWVLIGIDHAIKAALPYWESQIAGVQVIRGDDIVVTFFEKSDPQRIYAILRFPHDWFTAHRDELRAIVEGELGVKSPK